MTEGGEPLKESRESHPTRRSTGGADHLCWRHQATSLLSTYVHEHDILPIIGKIARGVIYLDCGKRIEDDYVVKVWRGY